jgi:hypothetical protein
MPKTYIQKDAQQWMVEGTAGLILETTSATAERPQRCLSVFRTVKYKIQATLERSWMLGTIVRRELLRELHLEIPFHFVY